DRYCRLLRPRGERADHRRSALPLPAGAGDRDQGRPRTSWARPVEAERATGASARGLRGQPAPAEARANRPLPAAPHRSRGAVRVAVTALPRDAPHPGDLQREAPGRERGRGAARAVDGRLRRDRARVLTGVSPLTAVATSSACPASPGE